MLNFMYKFDTPWAKANKAQVAINRGLGLIANMVYPIYCKNTSINKGKPYSKSIISLTTYPARIEKVYYCINSLLRQSVQAEKVILWLAESQFPNMNDDLPKALVGLCKHGLEIRYCDDLRSYKKIFYTAQEYSDYIIITADDDTMYPEDWLEGLLDTYNRYPNCVSCYRAHEITFKNNKMLPYRLWRGLSRDTKGPSLSLIPIGVGGVLYPPGYFKNVDFDFEIIKKNAPTTDDIWLKMIGIMNDVNVVKVNPNSKEWFTIRGSQKTSLKQINVVESSSNDDAMRNLMNYYNINESDMMKRMAGDE